jgi:hypothetical protein
VPVGVTGKVITTLPDAPSYFSPTGHTALHSLHPSRE